MTFPEILGNNDVERLSNGFAWQKAKDTLGTCVPKDNPALRVRVNNRIGRVLDKKEVHAVNFLGQEMPSVSSIRLVSLFAPDTMGFGIRSMCVSFRVLR